MLFSPTAWVAAESGDRKRFGSPPLERFIRAGIDTESALRTINPH